MLSAGALAPSINLPDLSGEQASLAQSLKTGPVILAFFKVSCPTCQYTFPFLQRFADKGIPIIGVSQDNPGATTAFVEAHRLRFPIWLDNAAAGYAASNAYKITHVPSIFFIEPDGTISHAGSGFSKDDLQTIGERFAFVPFSQTEQIPAFRPG